MSTDLEDRIRQRAHAIWEAQGRPEGCEKQHWQQAEAEFAAAAQGNGQAAPAPKAAKPRAAKPKAVQAPSRRSTKAH